VGSWGGGRRAAAHPASGSRPGNIQGIGFPAWVDLVHRGRGPGDADARPTVQSRVPFRGCGFGGGTAGTGREPHPDARRDTAISTQAVSGPPTEWAADTPSSPCVVTCSWPPPPPPAYRSAWALGRVSESDPRRLSRHGLFRRQLALQSPPTCTRTLPVGVGIHM